MKLSCALLPAPNAGELAARAEALGYERAWFPDSPALYGDVWISLADAARATRRIGLGTSVLIPTLRHPAVTAAAIAHLEALAPGRLRVALGSGFTGRRMFGQKPISLAVLERTLRQIQGLLRGDAVEIDGVLVKMMHPAGVVAARPMTTPLLLAAGGPRQLALAHALGCGVMCAGVVPEGARDVAMLAMGSVLAPGETYESPRVVEAIGPAIAVVWHGTYEARPELVDQLPGGRLWREELEKLPASLRHLHVHEGHLVEMTPRDRRAYTPLLAGTTFSGTPAELRQKAKDLEAKGVGELVYWPLGPDPGGELARMAEALRG
jgi:5,10-methylenetetrahydromethanopterin reductase